MAHVSLTFVVVLSCLAASIQGFNITSILEAYPDYGLFNEWLSLTGVANEVNARTGLTVLASTNSSVQSYVSQIKNASTQPGLGEVADTLRYQILLTYYGIPELMKITLNNFTEVTTLLQTTGRTNDSAGFVDIFHVNDTTSNSGGTKFVISHFIPDSYGNETIVKNVTALPYEYSILEVSSVVIPLPTTSPAPLPSPTMAPAPSSGTSPPAPLLPTPPVGPAASTSPTGDNFAGTTTVSAPLTVTAMLLASMAVLL